MVSFLNTSRYSKLKTQNTKTETLLYTAAHRQPHIVKHSTGSEPWGRPVYVLLSRTTSSTKKQHNQIYTSTIQAICQGNDQPITGEQHPLVNVNKGVKCGRIFGLYNKLIYIYKAIRRRRANQSQRSRARTSSSSARWSAQTRLTKEQERTEKYK